MHVSCMIVFLCTNQFDVVLDFDAFLRLRVKQRGFEGVLGWKVGSEKYGWMGFRKIRF